MTIKIYIWEKYAMDQRLRIQSNITPEVFREFALFDTMGRQKRYKGPALFAAVMAAFTCICFTQAGRREHALLLGGVLLGVGVLLPAAYILSFLLSVRSKARLLKKVKKPAYAVELSPEGVTVTAGGQRSVYGWADIPHVYRIRRSTCLYVAADRAYLLPVQEDDDRLWQMLCVHIPQEKRKDMRK